MHDFRVMTAPERASNNELSVGGRTRPSHRVVRFPVVLAKGIGGRLPEKPLFEAAIDGDPFVLWELSDGRVACASGVCPHKPAAPAVLNRRGVVVGDDLLCSRHANLYSGKTGACVQVAGAGAPGTMRVYYGHRHGDEFVIVFDS